MFRSKMLLVAACAAAVFLTSSCGVIMSTQSYGSPTRGHSVSAGASRADVLANLGIPNSVYRSADTEAFLYKGIKGRNCLGLYSSIKRNDMIVVMDSRGIVLTANTIDAGRGSTWLSPPGLDATHPVRTRELLYEPENYEYEYTTEAD